MKLTTLIENINQPKKLIIFSGRFQPFHAGHFQVYQHLVNKFGEDNVYIASSNKTNENSPFSFIEKQYIANTMFGVPNNKFIYTQQPYRPYEITAKLDPSKCTVIFALSEKDSDRFAESSFFKKYHKYADLPYSETAYLYTLPVLADDISATKIRNGFIQAEDKKKFFTDIYGEFNQSVYELFLKKIQ